MKRRHFLTTASTSLAWLLLPEQVARASPCPPPTLQMDDEAPLATSCTTGSSLMSFRLTSAVGGTLLPFSLGYPFKMGDVPSGQFITSNLADFQADIRNRWSDGSVKFAVLSGKQSLSAGVPSTITVQRSGNASSAANLPEPSPATMGSTISVTLTGAGAGTYTPQPAATNGTIAWNRSTASKVREFLGPVMSEFHYYSPTSDPHLTLWWYVRVYSDRTEVETAIEQGWLKVASVANKTYSWSIRVGGATSTGTNLNHRHHARWSRRDWIGSDPEITTAHNLAYVASTKLVPNYAVTSISSALLNGYAQTSTPMTRGSLDQDMTGVGSHSALGLMSEWDAAYFISGDARAYKGMLSNEQASNCTDVGQAGGSSNGAGFLQRDELTGYPAAPTDYTTGGYNNVSSPFVAGPTGGAVSNSDTAHSWNAGYAAYLATGRWFSLETAQFNLAADFFTASGSGGIVRTGSLQDRGCAWLHRTAAAAFAITPDVHPSKAKYRNYIEANYASWASSQIGANNLGIRTGVSPYESGDYAPSLGGRWFMQYFVSQSFAFAYHVAGDALGTTGKANLLAIAQFHLKWPAGLAGTASTYPYWRAAQYEGLFGSSLSPKVWASDFAGVYALMKARNGWPTESSGHLTDGNYPNLSSYWGNYLPGLSYAAEFGVAGAVAGYAATTSDSNWAALIATAGEAPQWAILKR